MNTLKELRSKLDSIRSRAGGQPDPALRNEARALVDETWTAMTSLMDGARAASRELRADEAREYDSLEAVVEEARTLESANTWNFGEQPVHGDLRETADSPEVRAAFDSFLRTGDDRELRDMGVGVSADGGYTVPEGFRAKLIERLKAHGGIRSAAESLTTDDGRDLPFPTADETGNSGEIVAEHAEVSEQGVTVGQKSLGAYLYSSKLVKVSFQLLQDNGIQLDQRLGKILATRIFRAQSPHFAVGTGSSQPSGLVPNVSAGPTASAVDGVTYADLLSLQHSVDPAYRDGASWVLNDTTFSKIRALVDGNGRPLWAPDVRAGAPNQLLGHPVVIDSGVPDLGASNRSIVFGSIAEAYVIRDVKSVSVLRLSERFATAHQVGFLAFLRSDALVQDSEAAKALVHPAS